VCVGGWGAREKSLINLLVVHCWKQIGTKLVHVANQTWMIILYTIEVFVICLSNWPTRCTKFLFYNKFISCLYMFRAPCAHHQEVKIVLYSLWYHHPETSEWSKIAKIQFFKWEQIVVKFMCEFFGCDYCVLLTVNMLRHVEVMFIQLSNLLERYYVYLHLCLLSLSCHKIV